MEKIWKHYLLRLSKHTLKKIWSLWASPQLVCKFFYLFFTFLVVAQIWIKQKLLLHQSKKKMKAGYSNRLLFKGFLTLNIKSFLGAN
jgi:hypothetical protein